MDGVSGAKVQWEEGKGIPVDINHAKPSEQALLDFSENVINNGVPKTNVITGSTTAIAVQMGLVAMYKQEIIPWNENVLA